jgi:Domain of unknown function (DUF4919)
MSQRYMARLLALIAGGILLAAAAFATAETVLRFDDLLAQAKRNGVAVDFKVLRYAYAESTFYNPYDVAESELRKQMVKALTEDKDCDVAIRHAQTILDKNYVSIDAHIMLDVCYRRLGQTKEADHHGLMAHGLGDSIVTPEDGKTPQTAFVVISIQEEQSVLSMLGLKKARQALIEVEGHKYDLIAVESGSGGTKDVFFNVDRPLSWLARNKGSR